MSDGKRSSGERGSQEPRLCHVCKKEIPESSKRSAEGRDYTYYFCGAGCEQRWQQEQHNPRHVVKSE